MTGHMRVLRPHPAIFAFYDGRVPGYRFAEEPNWVDEGALALGIASYAIVSGTHALVYDTHVSLPHAAEIRETLAQEGVTTFTVVLSHWHLDHVAGTGAFADCEIISTERTAAHLERHRAAIEAGTHEGPPAISPLVLPTRVFSGTLALDIGAIRLELIEADIHSDDAAVVWWESERILLAGDTMEDTVTYVTEPDGLERHLVDLARLDALAPARILPNHGDPDIIARGGYSRGLNRAMQQYVRTLLRARSDAALRASPLKSLIQGPLNTGWITYYAPYEEVHKENLEKVCGPT
ncbi:MBL fold metallo-hydrolase [Hyphomicrobium sp.]|uniref:MBL fold metallo-hydrolase n=1 Tax=Hyphomicrobium sp. TaxID=82 RepID=UPI0025BB7472|nr:MBL fold metallo-hydrolase [Hyphomicrobium sp.]